MSQNQARVEAPERKQNTQVKDAIAQAKNLT